MSSPVVEHIYTYVTTQLGWQPSLLQKAYNELQWGYRANQLQGYENDDQLKAYVFARFPATYAVCYALLRQHFEKTTIKSVIDWGSGVGTASLALANIMSQPIIHYLIEKNAGARKLSQQFLEFIAPSNRLHFEVPEESADLGIMSYSLNELGEKNWQDVVLHIWEKVQYLLIIEPGTSLLFQKLLKVRAFLQKHGAVIMAPCCHQKVCPLKNTENWCHFIQRLPRSKAMRFLKNAERGFEDEAYSYLLVCKDELLDSRKGRIINKPRAHGKHVQFDICDYSGNIIEHIVTKSSPVYKRAKKAKWGDTFSLIEPYKI